MVDSANKSDLLGAEDLNTKSYTNLNVNISNIFMKATHPVG